MNVTVKPTLLPAGIVTGSVNPLTTNSALLTFTAVTCTAEPLAISDAGRAEFVPTTTLWKFRVVGDTANVPCAVPMPDNGIFRVGFDASEVMARFPFEPPPDSGVNTTLNVTLCPDVRVNGGFNPVTLKPAPVTVS